MASAMARFLYTLRDTDAAPAATNGHDRATLAHAHEFSDRTATTRSCSQDRNTHRAWRNAETTARTNKHHDRRDNCATNNTTIAETTAQQTTPRSQRQLRKNNTHQQVAMEVGPASEYSESSYPASGFARHCTPPRRPGPRPETPGPAGRCLELATNGIKIKKKKKTILPSFWP